MKIMELSKETKELIVLGAEAVGAAVVLAAEVKLFLTNRKLKKQVARERAIRKEVVAENDSLRDKVRSARMEGKIDTLTEIVKGNKDLKKEV